MVHNLVQHSTPCWLPYCLVNSLNKALSSVVRGEGEGCPGYGVGLARAIGYVARDDLELLTLLPW